MKLLVGGLLPLILLWLLTVRQSIMYAAIGVPILLLWALSGVAA